MDLSLPHILLLLLIILILFGGRKIPEVMRGLGQGIREFKEGMRDPGTPGATPPSSSTPSQTTQEKK